MRSTPELSDEQPYNLNNELAKERTRAASDRTLMAWMRTSLSLIGFGFGIPTIVKTLESTRAVGYIDPHRFSVIVGLAFISVGMFGMAAALKDHRMILKRIQSDRYTYETSRTAEIVSMLLLLIGAISFIGVLIRSLNL